MGGKRAETSRKGEEGVKDGVRSSHLAVSLGLVKPLCSEGLVFTKRCF